MVPSSNQDSVIIRISRRIGSDFAFNVNTELIDIESFTKVLCPFMFYHDPSKCSALPFKLKKTKLTG